MLRTGESELAHGDQSQQTLRFLWAAAWGKSASSMLLWPDSTIDAYGQSWKLKAFIARHQFPSDPAKSVRGSGVKCGHEGCLRVGARTAAAVFGGRGAAMQ